MSARFRWTPRGEAVNQTMTVNWGEIQRQAPEFVGERMQSVSTGGTVVNVIRDAYFLYTLETNPINRANSAGAWQRITSFVAHAQTGGVFEYFYDFNNNLDTTLSSGVSAGATSLTLGSTTNLAVDDFIYIEDVDDPTKWELRKVTSLGAPITIDQGVSWGFGAGSIVRHAEYFPKCVATRITFEERRAGQGPNVWDFGVTFRTVRA